jgi:hypothetical protein
MQAGGGGQIGAPIFAQGPSFGQPSPQQVAAMQQMWLQQQYVEAVQTVMKQRERQQRLALRRQRVAKQREEEEARREANWARIAAKTEEARAQRELAEAARASFRASLAENP